ncbi:hypothetical protein [Frankia sp. R82]|nr:hypothetical protein [Frankia sp. R82]MCM3883373.1 hypothetical protein [Frankia sp. R82]
MAWERRRSHTASAGRTANRVIVGSGPRRSKLWLPGAALAALAALGT